MKRKYNNIARKNNLDISNLDRLCLTKAENRRIVKFLKEHGEYQFKRKTVLNNPKIPLN